MTFVLTFAVIAAALAALGVTAFHRAPTRTTCPQCKARTADVRPPPVLRSTERVVRWRWCAACGWQGVGRAGPDWIPGRLLAHDSGFHWGDERFPEDFGFRWRADEPPAPEAAPPDHPSGFRFGADARPEGSPAHPSGFAWAGGEPAEGGSPAREVAATPDGQSGGEGDPRAGGDDGRVEKAHPSGFAWRSASAREPAFSWAPPAEAHRRRRWGGRG